MRSCAQDGDFGPASTCRTLDFTEAFEQSILSLSPDALFFLVAVFRLGYLRQRDSGLNYSPQCTVLIATKCAIALLLVSSNLVNLIQHGRHTSSSSLALSASILQAICSVLLAGLVVIENLKSLAPSTLIVTYSFLKGVFTGTILRTSLKNEESGSILIVHALLVSTYLFLFLIELKSKHHLLRDQDIPQVSTASFVSRSLYLWLLPLLWAGRKRNISIDDCGTIPLELRAAGSRQPLLGTLVNMPHRSLLRASLRAYPLLFLSPIPPPGAVVGCIVCAASVRWALVGGFICTYGLISLTTSIYWEKVFNCTVQYRGALVGNIYGKTLRLSSSAGREVGGGVASTYMSVDVERVCQGLESLHELWATCVSIILAVALLYSLTTWPAFLPLAITAIILTTSGYASRGIVGAHMAWLDSTDKRVKFLVSIINNYLPMKLGRYEDGFVEHAASLRAQEMKGARSFYFNLTSIGALTATAWAASILSVLGPYSALAAHHGALNPQRLFTIVATLNLLAPPLSTLGVTMPQLGAAYTSLKRIEHYLRLEERVPPPEALNDSKDEKSFAEPPISICLQNASFSWGADKSAFLGPISLELSPFKLHVCVGAVASGKTFLLLSLLGETVCTGGVLLPAGTPIAYAAQEPLIISGSIRDNILFGKEFDEEWYNTVLDACALPVDIDRMDGKDGTFVGEKGTTLSGGQRQRIALARAVYARAPWTFLDDSFSAIDGDNESHIFGALFGATGLLKNRGVVLVTHNVKHLQAADNVVVLKAGSVEYHGKLDDIIALGYNFDRNTETNRNPSTQPHSPEVMDRTKVHIDEKESDEKSVPRASRGIVPYLFYMRMAGWSGSLAVVVLLSLTGLMRLALQIYLQQCAFGMWGFSIVITGPVGLNIHSTELRGLLRAAPSYFASTPSGRIINRFSQDIFMCDLDFPQNTLEVILPATILMGSLVFILVATPWLTLAVPFLGAFYWAILSFYLRTSQQLQQLGAASKSPLYTLFSTTVSGLITIRALGVEKHFEAQNDHYLDRSQIPFYYRFAGICFLRTFLSFISFIIATGLSALAVGLRHSTSPSSLGLALAGLTSMTGQMSELLMNFSSLENSAVAVSRIHEIATLPAEEDPGLDTPDDSLSEKINVRGTVAFESVRLQYRSDLGPALENVSFQISAGQKVGVCGRTGSGKSSLIMAMFRAVEPSLMSGRVSIDGKDTKTIPLHALRNSLSLVAQNPFLWNASIRHNLDPYGVSPDKDIWLALERVGLGTAVSQLPDKLETVIEEGSSFSGGQRQLLCLARVLLRKRKIVVLDEASSSLDIETDMKIREVIRTDLADCTVISVAHRIQTIIDFDFILVLEDDQAAGGNAVAVVLRS
ncbi:hypothetical protein MSAN_01695700 [Mycena sanguinolenta]|uniref:P-loop containing nucleoside triphosphate hydrolase protein n=1 Tax=Mycena sanguinolenta TaxID=230812 RepID=A0A8H7CTE1_9AGAR|nr:hypothetical protein MSAN_01695700 [Mycena sanguinolenta]